MRSLPPLTRRRAIIIVVAGLLAGCLGLTTQGLYDALDEIATDCLPETTLVD